MRVNEIFASIDGEGVRAGELATFIRLAGCNLRCSYCDTPYALKGVDGDEMTVKEIVDKAKEIGYKNITLTGGEPLVHSEVRALIDSLVCNGFKVNIETNGSIDIAPYRYADVIITADYKTRSSGCSEKMLMSNISALRKKDVLKFVMTKDDFDEVEAVLREYKPESYIYLSPVFGKIEPCDLVGFQKHCFDSGLDTSKMRVQLQLHKYIWNPEERGV